MLPGPASAAPSAFPLCYLASAEYDDRIRAAMTAAEAAGVKLQPPPDVLQVIRSADAFTFDVDSTL